VIDSETCWGSLWVILLAAAFGAFGGFVYELLQKRLHRSGVFVRAGGSRRTMDFGSWSSITVGAAAAIAFLYFLPPSGVVTDTEPSLKYNVIRLVAASIMAGSVGGIFFAAVQDRAKRLVQETKDQERMRAVLLLNEARAQGARTNGEESLVAEATTKIAAIDPEK
jgi:hypothetical protein